MTGAADATSEGPPLERFAFEKLTRVLGATHGRGVFDETLAAAGLTAIRTPDDLYAFGARLSKRSGFEAAIGSLLTVAAVLRGASRHAP